jgi:autotransporter translocation and assembly factor TamB
MKSFSYEGTLHAGVPSVAALYTDKEFLTAFVKSLGVVDAKVDVGERAATLVWQVPTNNFPSFLRPLLGNRIPLTERISWTTIDGIQAKGPYQLSIDVRGRHARLDTTATLDATADGCMHRIKGNIRVDLPFIGGKVEDAATKPLLSLMTDRTTFANTWLRERS